MDDLDLYQALSTRPENGEEMLELLKISGAREVVREIADKGKTLLRDNKYQVIGGSSGAAVGAGLGYLFSRRAKKDGKSLEERAADRLAKAVESRKSDSPSFTGKMLGAKSRAYSDMAKVYAEHPGWGSARGAMMAAPAGWKFGKNVADAVKKIKTSASMTSPLRGPPSIPKPTMPKFTATPKLPGAPTLPKVASRGGISMNKVDQARRAANDAVRFVDYLKGTSAGTRTLLGGAAGAGIGYATGGGYKYDEKAGGYREKRRWPRTLGLGALGAAAGGLSHQEGRQWLHAKLTGTDKFLKSKKATMTKEADLWSLGGRAASAMASMGQKVAPALNRVGPSVGGALKQVAQAPASTRLGVGAASGAIMGAARHMMKPKDQATGRRQGSMIGSIAKGTAIGAGTGLATPSFVGQVQNNRHISDFMLGRLGTRPAPMRTKQLGLPLGPPPAA